MEQTTTIRLPQERETPVTVVRQARYTYRYAYARSADSRAAGDRGQDYLVIRDDGQRLAFALCDGVSQSFLGDLAARIVGETLVDWLWTDPTPPDDLARDQTSLITVLRDLTTPASDYVRAFPLPEGLPPMVYNVLEHKRALGSESTFSAGLIDMRADQLLLVWMGDSRIRFWGAHGERSRELGDAFHTREHWSSRRGPLGQAHVFVTRLQDLQRLVIYSDGLAQLDGEPAHAPPNVVLDALIAGAGASPTSDDISFFEVQLEAHPDFDRPAAAIPVRVDTHPEENQMRDVWELAHEADELSSGSRRASFSTNETTPLASLPEQTGMPESMAPDHSAPPAVQPSARRRLRKLVIALILIVIVLGGSSVTRSGRRLGVLLRRLLPLIHIMPGPIEI